MTDIFLLQVAGITELSGIGAIGLEVNPAVKRQGISQTIAAVRMIAAEIKTLSLHAQDVIVAGQYFFAPGPDQIQGIAFGAKSRRRGGL